MTFILPFFLYSWLRCVFVAVHRLSPVAATGDYSWLRCTGFSLQGISRYRAQALGTQALGVTATSSADAVRRLGSCGHRLSCFSMWGIFLDQGPNPCPLNWKVYSYPLHHQGSPWLLLCWDTFLLCLRFAEVCFVFNERMLNFEKVFLHLLRWSYDF